MEGGGDLRRGRWKGAGPRRRTRVETSDLPPPPLPRPGRSRRPESWFHPRAARTRGVGVPRPGSRAGELKGPARGRTTSDRDGTAGVGPQRRTGGERGGGGVGQRRPVSSTSRTRKRALNPSPAAPTSHARPRPPAPSAPRRRRLTGPAPSLASKGVTGPRHVGAYLRRPSPTVNDGDGRRAPGRARGRRRRRRRRSGGPGTSPRRTRGRRRRPRPRYLGSRSRPLLFPRCPPSSSSPSPRPSTTDPRLPPRLGAPRPSRRRRPRRRDLLGRRRPVFLFLLRDLLFDSLN